MSLELGELLFQRSAVTLPVPLALRLYLPEVGTPIRPPGSTFKEAKIAVRSAGAINWREAAKGFQDALDRVSIEMREKVEHHEGQVIERKAGRTRKAQKWPLARNHALAPTVSAIFAPRAPSGWSAPSVVSLAV